MRSEATGELHIADIRTPSGLVIEFQHSAIDPAERSSREAFYVNMLWVVDGTRLKGDRPRIDDAIPNWPKLPEGNIEKTGWPEGTFPRRWVESTVPVLFDFGGRSAGRDGAAETPLICLLPNRYADRALFFPVNRATLTKIADNEARIFDWRIIHQKLAEQDMRMMQLMRRRIRRSRF